MKTINVQKLSQEAFRQYGTFQNLLDNEGLAAASVNKRGFFADVITLNFGNTTLPAVSVCPVNKEEKNIIAFMEAHRYTCEGLLPLDADVIIYVGRVMRGELSPETIEAFYVPQGTFVKLDPLILHGRQFVMKAEEAHILCLLPQRTFHNDMMAKFLEEKDQIEILI
jgi:ureidoglycolate lyase